MDNGVKTLPDSVQGKFGLAVGFVVIAFVNFGLESLEDYPGQAIGIVCIVVAILIAIKAIKQIIDERRECEYQERLQEQEQAKARAIIDHFARGEWKFPVSDFYAACQKEGANDMSNAFCAQKAFLIAMTIAEDAGVPQQYRNIYVTKAKVLEYYAQADAVEVARKNAIQKDYEFKSQHPQMATPDDDERMIINHAAAVMDKTGLNKRDFMFLQQIGVLRSAIQEMEKEIEIRAKNEEEAQKAMIQLGVAMMEASQEPTRNWGLAGGIASAIGGFGAGVAAAADAMAENAAIERRNAQNSAYYRNLTARMVVGLTESNASSYALRRERDALAEKCKEIENERLANRTKVVLDNLCTQDLLPYIKPTLLGVTRKPSSVLEITLSLENTYVPDVPNGVKMVMDGLISLDIYKGDIKVGTACAPLPLYGIPCGHKTTMTALCNYYLEGDQTYTVKYNYHYLWIMQL